MAAIGPGWETNAWIEASWIAGAWGRLIAGILPWIRRRRR